MHPRFFHIYHIVPIFLLTNAVGSDPDFLSVYSSFNPLWIILAFAAFLFLGSLQHKSTIQRLWFLTGSAILTALTLIRLLPNPAMAVLISTIFCMIVIPKQTQPFSYKRMFLVSHTSLLVSFGLATLVFASMLVNIDRTNNYLFFAGIVASCSVIFIASAKLKVKAHLVYAGIIGLLATALLRVYFNPLASHFFITAIIYSICALTTGGALIYSRSLSKAQLGQFVFAQPAAIIILYFTVFAGLGAILLAMPLAQSGAAHHSFIDSLFTAMSAVCVTGLIVLDTPVDFSFFGQGVILMLIQIGGIGIVSLSAWLLFVFQSKRLSVQHEQAISDLSAYKPTIPPKQMIKRILGYFFACEFLGAVVLCFAFIQLGDPAGIAVWRALFTAISAFCNAGFAIQSESLIPYQSNALVLFTSSSLIIAGGFAPLLVLNFPVKRIKQWNLQEKICVSSTAFLLITGMLFYLFLEWSHSLQDLAVFEKFTNAWFQSVTARTAGFNSVDLTQMRDVTTFIFMILMFIGGNPGSAAGGVKTVTIAILFFATISTLKRSTGIRAFHRKIPTEIVYKAIAITSLGLATGFFAFLILAVTQQIDTLKLLFETVSALGTVGVSLGITGKLDGVGKIIIMICMLMGRVGPITFVLSMLRVTPNWDVPEDDVYVS